MTWENFIQVKISFKKFKFIDFFEIAVYDRYRLETNTDKIFWTYSNLGGSCGFQRWHYSGILEDNRGKNERNWFKCMLMMYLGGIGDILQENKFSTENYPFKGEKWTKK